MSGIYIHIPFCKQACSYCDFYFVTRDRLVPEFVDALLHEISTVPVGDGSPFPGDPVRTLYLGGGTPSRLPLPQLKRIFDTLHRHFGLSGLEEVTVEVNPEDVTADLLAGLRDMGVTRLSMGVQSFQPELLEFMHRVHSAPEAHKALEKVVHAGFSSFSVDVIYGCPGQTEAQLQDDLDQLLVYDPPHLSAYSLTIEPHTRLGKQAKLGRLTPADDETVARQSRLIRDVLAPNGIHKYEISNYARHGHEAEHNSAYWSHENYLGLGPAAHSFYWPGRGLERRPWTGMERGHGAEQRKDPRSEVERRHGAEQRKERRVETKGEQDAIPQRGSHAGMKSERQRDLEGELQEEFKALRWYHPSDIHMYGRLVRSDGFRAWLDRVLGGARGYRSDRFPAAPQNHAATPGSRFPENAGYPQDPASSEILSLPPDGLESEQLSLKTLAGERLMTGLRTRSGVESDELASRYGHPLTSAQLRLIAGFRERGLMEPEEPLRLTDAGCNLADAIIVRLLG